MQNYFERKVMKNWYLKKGFDVERLKFLEEELKKIELGLKYAESERYV